MTSMTIQGSSVCPLGSQVIISLYADNNEHSVPLLPLPAVLSHWHSITHGIFSGFPSDFFNARSGIQDWTIRMRP